MIIQMKHFKDINLYRGTIFKYNTKTFEQTTFRWYEIEKYLDSDNFKKVRLLLK